MEGMFGGGNALDLAFGGGRGCRRCLPLTCVWHSNRWTQGPCSARNAATLCPVCKASVAVEKVVPIYGRGIEAVLSKVEPLPPRPAGQRPTCMMPSPPPALHLQPERPVRLNNLLGFAFDDTDDSDLTPEQQRQAFLSRLLIMLGSFVIMCLLLF